MSNPSPGTRQGSRKSVLAWLILAGWVFFAFIVHAFAEPLNAIKLIGFPLGYYMAAQGSLIAFVALLFIHARKQDDVERDAASTGHS